MKNTVNISVDAARPCGEQEHYWNFIGYDECNYTYIQEGRELLEKFAALGDGPYYFRTHFMLCTGNCHGSYKFGSTNIYLEDENGEPIYDFTFYDMIVDAYLQTGCKPFLEIGFMPRDLADTRYLPLKDTAGRWEWYCRYKEIGWTCPPKSYDKWHGLIAALAQHLKDKYGEEEIATWYFELWNEPNAFNYWGGTTADYCKLYDYTEDALHRVLPQARLSGPSVVGLSRGNNAESFFKAFLGHCREGANYRTGKAGARLDFITFHVKGGGFPFNPRAKKGNPSTSSLVHQVKVGLDIIVEYGYQDLEVVLSEADPDGWAAGGTTDNPNMVFRNTEYYATYVASTYVQIEALGEKYGIKVRPLAWAFMFPMERCFDGTRTFTTQGIDKPVFNLFKMLGRMGDKKLALISDGVNEADMSAPLDIKAYMKEAENAAKPDISGFAAQDADGRIQILVFSHHEDREFTGGSEVSVRVAGAGEGYRLKHYRIDAAHSNAYAEWLRQGSPMYPDKTQYAHIKERDGLEPYSGETRTEVTGSGIQLTFDMPAHAVSLLELSK